MNIIKLNAIDSTNSYLKNLSNKTDIENYTVVVAKHQTAGRGQMGTNWLSDEGKNLTFSILIRLDNFKIEHQFYLSMAISLGILEAIIPKVNVPLSIKWPNDILAEKDKIAGILIENVLGVTIIKQSVIGIGINVNQDYFSSDLGNVTSLKNATGIDFNLEDLLLDCIKSIQRYADYVERNEFKLLKEKYLSLLYKYNVPAMFEDKNSAVFMGKIMDVSEEGKLVVELENETIHKFNLKEIKFMNR